MKIAPPGDPGPDLYDFGWFLEVLDFSCFLDRRKVKRKCGKLPPEPPSGCPEPPSGCQVSARAPGRARKLYPAS